MRGSLGGFMRSLRRLAVLVSCLLASSPVLALVDPHGEGAAQDPRIFERAEPMPREVAVSPDDSGSLAAAARGFILRRGGTWEFRMDSRTGRATMVQGSGIPLVPGRGNALGADALAGLPLADGDVTVETLAPLVERFLRAEWTLVGPVRGELTLDRKTSLTLEGGRLHFLHYGWSIGGVPVEGAGFFASVNSGNLTQFGAPFVGDAAVATEPALDGADAARRLLLWSGDEELARVLGDPELKIQIEDGDDRLGHRLIWIVRYSVPGRIETWEGRVDAWTGEVVSFSDANRYGRATGGVYARTVVDPEIVVALPFTSVVAGGTIVSDAAGGWAYVGGPFSSGMDGRWFDQNCRDGCTNPAQASVSSSLGTGRVDFGTGGVDAVGNGFSSKADRNAFFHLNQVRRIAKKWLPSLGWLDTTIASNVNINSTCNAFWDGSVNFYRSGGGCNNTGEIADVMQHEWGHGVDGNTRGADGATGEGTADTVAVHMTRDARIGPWFRTTGAPVRDLEKTRTSKGLMTRTNVGQKCGPGSGAQGYQVHCEGEIYGQTTWDLGNSLAAKHGFHTGWRTSERIFFTSLPNAGSYLPTGSFPIYDAYINADDDDGNLANGTPNGGEIYAAFNLHEIAGTPRVSSPGCARPAQPAVTVTPSCDRFTVSWNSVTGATRYDVMRGEILANSPFYPVASVNAPQTSFQDLAVAPGVDYYYVVMAVNASGCESTVENPVAARLVSQPILSVTAAIADDLPRGNRSGFPDPGEEVDLRVTFGNFGDVASGNLTATLTSSTPGVTILEGTDSWPDLAPGAAAENTGILRFRTNAATVDCGSTVRFRLDPAAAAGCSAEDSYLDVVLGEQVTVRADDFEAGPSGWAYHAPSSTATAGNWTWGDPDPTAYQPGDDVTPDPGVNCWFTAPNPGGEGTDDVDGGVTTLLSPVIDLSAYSDARISYWRWFANRDLGEDEGDYFRADVSSDGGTNWVNLETLDMNQSAAAWTKREFDLENFIPLTAQVRIRFQASDGPATGNLIEAAIDEVRIERFACDDTPACYTAPTFAGLASALAGASCGETSLSWNAASSNCQNATIRYNVYRSTDPGFLPGPANRIAAGLATLSFEDSLLQPGVTYHYVVRADDSRSGEDANLVRRSVVAPTSPDTKAPIFDGVVSAATGAACGETTLSWAAGLETCNVPVTYEVYRSTDPGFVPSPSTRVASTTSLSYVDAALAPGVSYTYVVRSRDGAGNEDANLVRATAPAKVLDRVLFHEDFEAGANGWARMGTNDATTGLWELGDPEATTAQPGDDYTADPGVNAWVTGLLAGADAGAFDVDNGTTTLVSRSYDLSAAVDPVVRYARWFTNDRGANPGEDPFDVDASNDGGSTWSRLEQVSGGTPLAWVVRDVPLAGILAPTSTMRFRFVARDLGVGGSLVEAAVDEFFLLDRNQGCSGCPLPVGTVGTIVVSRSGNDVVLDWTADPVSATRYVVYKLTGPGLSQAVRIGTTGTKQFVHAGAATSGESFYYRVSAVDACGNESGL